MQSMSPHDIVGSVAGGRCRPDRSDAGAVGVGWRCVARHCARISTWCSARRPVCSCRGVEARPAAAGVRPDRQTGPHWGWPLRGSPQVVADENHSMSRVRRKTTASFFRSKVSGDGIPVADVDLVGTGNLDGLKLAPLQLGLPDGRLRVGGTIGWSGGVSWDVDACRTHQPGPLSTGLARPAPVVAWP